MIRRSLEIWARSLGSPRTRLLPGIGHRLGRRPRVASTVLGTLRGAPTRTLRTTLYANVSRPLVERMDARLVVPVAGGSRMIVDTSDMIGRVLAASGVWEPHVTDVFPELLAPGDVFVDVGAHTGYFTLMGWKLVGSSGRVYALEPSESSFRVLRTNIALNEAWNVTALRVAAGAHDGSAQLVDPPPGNIGETSIHRTDGRESWAKAGAVPIQTVPTLLVGVDSERVRLVKIDVEGYEAEVITGLVALYDEGVRPALVVEVHPDDARNAIDVLSRMCLAYGLHAFALRPNPYRDRFAEVRPPREVADPHDLLELCLKRTVNVLLTPDPAGLHRRSTRAGP